MKKDDSSGEEAASALRRQLSLASSEIEALRAHNKDLRDQTQSGWWSWQPSCSPEDGTGDGVSEATAGGEGGEEIGVWGSGAFEAYTAAEAALRKVGIAGVSGGNGSGDDTSASIEVDRLTSLLAEREAQVGVLTSSIEALRISPTGVKGGDTAIGKAASPRPRASRETTRTGNSRTSAASPQPRGGAGLGAAMRGADGWGGGCRSARGQGRAVGRPARGGDATTGVENCRRCGRGSGAGPTHPGPGEWSEEGRGGAGCASR
ncbi:unnamed protein product [Scytosiphon promiscuus]